LPACPPARPPACLQLGADEVVDYSQQRFEEVYKDRPFDAVLDAYGLGDYEQRRWAVQ
jgi:NADPH:quinone reductase-like Zn-dependent oxidoreductase